VDVTAAPDGESTMGFSGSDTYAAGLFVSPYTNSGRTGGWITVWTASDGWTWTDKTVTAGSVPTSIRIVPSPVAGTDVVGNEWEGGSWSRTAIPCSVAEHLTFTSVSTPHGDTSKNKVITQGPFPCDPKISISVTLDAGDPTLIQLAANGPNGKAYPVKGGEEVSWNVSGDTPGTTLTTEFGLTTTVRTTCADLSAGLKVFAGYGFVEDSVVLTPCPGYTPDPRTGASATPSATPSPAASAPAPVAPTNSGSDLLWVFLLILGLLLSLFLFWLDRRRKAPPA
jgi:hypothetical protein